MSNDDWATPDYLFRWLTSRFGFVLDAAADDTNHKCPHYYTKEQNGLIMPWADDGVTFCNPPYSEVGMWVGCAVHEWIQYERESVLLCPVRSDQAWWHEFVLSGICKVEWYKGRIKFSNAPGSAWMYNVNLLFTSPERPVISSIDINKIYNNWATEAEKNERIKLKKARRARAKSVPNDGAGTGDNGREPFGEG